MKTLGRMTSVLAAFLLLFLRPGISFAESTTATQNALPMSQALDLPSEMRPACFQMMAQMGGMASQPKVQPQQGEPTEHGTRQADGLEVTLLSAPPLSPAKMQEMMPGMGGMMGSQQGMGGMMTGQGQSPTPPTHWIGVVVRDVKDDRALPNLDITLTAKKDGVTRTVKLMPMPGSYGANISLPGKGPYTVTVAIARAVQPVKMTFPFQYE